MQADMSRNNSGQKKFFKWVWSVPMDKISYKDCNATYIGETKMSFQVRYKENNKAVRNGDIDKNEIAYLCWQNDHEMNWDERKEIDTGSIHQR